MVLNRMYYSEAGRTSWSPIQNCLHLQGREIVGLLKDAELRQLLTQDFTHRSFEIEHTGSLIISRNFKGSAVEHIELFQEAWIWATGIISLWRATDYGETTHSTSGWVSLSSSRAPSVSR